MPASVARHLGASLAALAALCPLVVSPSAHAIELKTRIFRLEAPSRPGAPFEVLSTNDGRVYYADPTAHHVLQALKQLSETKAPAQLELDGDRVVSAQKLPSDESSSYTDDFDRPEVARQAMDALREEFSPMPPSFRAALALGYQPTILSSMSQAQELFSSERELKHHSQCYERAHVWARSFESSHDVRSMKVFMFFTRKFRERYTTHFLFWDRPYKWWFHVAPFVYVGNQEIVLDREFLDQAVPLEDWTFHFIGEVSHDNHEVPNPSREEARCLDADRYAEYTADTSHLCALRKVPMYYFQPLDVEALDRDHSVLRTWRGTDLRRAYGDTL